MTEVEFRFKKVEELPNIIRETDAKYKPLVRQFMASNIPMADITEYIPKEKRNSQPMLGALQYAIRSLGIAHKVFATVRKKRAYIVNIELSGIKKSGRR